MSIMQGRAACLALASTLLICAGCDGKKGGEDATDTGYSDVVSETDGADDLDVGDTTGVEDVLDGEPDDDATDLIGEDVDPTDAVDGPVDSSDADLDDPAMDDGVLGDPDVPDTGADPDVELDAGLDADVPEETYEEYLVELPEEGIASIAGIVRRDGALTLGADAASDGVGTVLVALFDCEPFSQLLCTGDPLAVHESASPVDLSDPSAGYPYSFVGLTAGIYWVFAALDDDGSGFDLPAWDYAPVGPGDLASHPSPQFHLFATSTLTGADVMLDVRASSMHGQVTVDALLPYTGDGLGNLVVGAADVDPTSGSSFTLLGLDVMTGIDILDATPDLYQTVLLAPAGTLYVFAFLDDDAAGGIPVSGDPATIPAEISLLSAMGADITVDPVIDAIVP